MIASDCVALPFYPFWNEFNRATWAIRSRLLDQARTMCRMAPPDLPEWERLLSAERHLQACREPCSWAERLRPCTPATAAASTEITCWRT